MISVVITGDQAIINRLHRNLAGIISSTLFNLGQQLEKVLEIEPGPTSHPIQWTSLKQKRYYFWMRKRMLGALNNTGAMSISWPYRRGSDPMSQHLSRRGWTTKRYGRTSVIVGTNVSYAPFVQGVGAFQQRFHKNTGWVSAPDAVRRVLSPMMVKGAVARAIVQRLRL